MSGVFDVEFVAPASVCIVLYVNIIFAEQPTLSGVAKVVLMRLLVELYYTDVPGSDDKSQVYVSID